MIERMELGEFYKELRLARKLKQSDVACAGLTASQLSKFAKFSLFHSLTLA